MKFLERKKGESKSGGFKAPANDFFGRFRNSQEGIFGFRKDKHVVIPGVTHYEEERLRNVIDYVAKKTDKPCTLSQELINDIYSIYVNEDVKRRPENKGNSIRHKVLDSVHDSLTKIVTVDSPLYTQILTRELALVLQKVDDEINDKQEQNGEGNDGKDGGLESVVSDGSGNGDKDGQDDSKDSSSQSDGSSNSDNSKRSVTNKQIDDALDNAKKDIENAKKKADDKINDLEEKLGTEALKNLSDKSPDFLDEIDELKELLSRISISKESIKKVLSKILNESMNYFSPKFKTVEESLFDCEECEDLFGLEFLHPIFKNAEIMSVGNETRIYKGKIDLYLDCSGSMGSQQNFEGTDIALIDLVKGIAMILFRMGLIENLYFFNSYIHKVDDLNEISILSFVKSGGTDFNGVVNQIKASGNNSVIITDGQDSCKEYIKQAFWVGVGGTTFSRNEDSFSLYRGNRQCVAYNSRTSKFDYCV